jgi:cold shock CspA family protein
VIRSLAVAATAIQAHLRIPVLECVLANAKHVELPESKEKLEAAVKPAILACQGASHLEGEQLNARRISALCLQVLSALGIQVAAVDGNCVHCLASHPAVLCQFAEALDWTCAKCNSKNRNTGQRSYFCFRCLELRPEVSALAPAEVWICGICARSNPEFESHCIFCGSQRPVAGVETAPFYPSMCSACGDAYLEMTCPSCYDNKRREEAAETKWCRGVVRFVSEKFSFIQPCEDLSTDRGVFVSAGLARKAGLRTGQKVAFKHVVRSEGMRATHIKTEFL